MATAFNSHRFTADAGGQALIFRILKMQDSAFIYIGRKDDETFDGLGIGFVSNDNSKESFSSSITNAESSDSRDLAQKLSLRLKKPIFVSCNANFDRVTKPAIEQRLIEEIKEFPEYF